MTPGEALREIEVPAATHFGQKPWDDMTDVRRAEWESRARTILKAAAQIMAKMVER